MRVPVVRLDQRVPIFIVRSTRASALLMLINAPAETTRQIAGPISTTDTLHINRRLRRPDHAPIPLSKAIADSPFSSADPSVASRNDTTFAGPNMRVNPHRGFLIHPPGDTWLVRCDDGIA